MVVVCIVNLRGFFALSLSLARSHSLSKTQARNQRASCRENNNNNHLFGIEAFADWIMKADEMDLPRSIRPLCAGSPLDGATRARKFSLIALIVLLRDSFTERQNRKLENKNRIL